LQNYVLYFALPTNPLKFWPQNGRLNMPKITTVFRIFLSCVCVSFFGMFSSPSVFCVLNLPLAQDNPKGFMALWTVEETDLQLHLLASFVWSTGHCPFLLWRTHFGSALWTLSHDIPSMISGYDDLMVNE